MIVKELVAHFPKDFMVVIRTPICGIKGTVKTILDDDFVRNILVCKWEVKKVKDINILKIYN